MARRATHRSNDHEAVRYTEDPSISGRVYHDPEPTKVAKLWASHDWDACLARWHWVSAGKLQSIARTGRAMLGWSTGVVRERATSTAAEAVLIATAYALSNGLAAETASGSGCSSIRSIFDAWGIPRSDRPKISKEERSRLTHIGHGVAKRADWALMADAKRRAHERAVYEVVAASLALLPEPKPFGRPPLPEPSDALRAAVSHLPPAAVEVVFPGLLAPGSEETIVMSSAASIATTAPKQYGRFPDDETLRARLAAGTSVASIATEFGVTTAAIYQRRKALSVTETPQVSEATPAHEEPARQAVVPASAPAPEPVRTVTTIHAGSGDIVSNPLPLALEGLLRAREVILACGCHPMEAIALVRADMAHVRHESTSA